ncbi:hypothetical protein H4R33_001066 [Dimargaris cristalligena]|nr:hypothetical protein H4R33_001066 [Dimargaris cristalligena]
MSTAASPLVSLPSTAMSDSTHSHHPSGGLPSSFRSCNPFATGPSPATVHPTSRKAEDSSDSLPLIHFKQPMSRGRIPPNLTINTRTPVQSAGTATTQGAAGGPHASYSACYDSEGHLLSPTLTLYGDGDIDGEGDCRGDVHTNGNGDDDEDGDDEVESRTEYHLSDGYSTASPMSSADSFQPATEGHPHSNSRRVDEDDQPLYRLLPRQGNGYQPPTNQSQQPIPRPQGPGRPGWNAGRPTTWHAADNLALPPGQEGGGSRIPSGSSPSRRPGVPWPSPLPGPSSAAPYHQSPLHPPNSGGTPSLRAFNRPSPPAHPVDNNVRGGVVVNDDGGETRPFRHSMSVFPDYPLYDPPSYRRQNTGASQQSVASSGESSLPPYVCTIQKEGTLWMKVEFDDFDTRAKHRVWKQRYFQLWGTCLRIYNKKSKNPEDTEPIYNIGMQNVKAGLALDYRKKKHVFRVHADGFQFLLQAQTSMEMIGWIDSLQASTNIALPIEERKLPKFTPLSRRYRQMFYH